MEKDSDLVSIGVFEFVVEPAFINEKIKDTIYSYSFKIWYISVIIDYCVQTMIKIHMISQ